MRLVMVGIDYTSADMETRERFIIPVEERAALLVSMTGGDISGCVLIATCNRTELYISYTGDAPPDGTALLCGALGMDAGQSRRVFVQRSDRLAVIHLMRVAGGLESIVPGDDQIITQVRNAMGAARQAGTGDPLLESLFRLAVTAGKRIRTTIAPHRKNISVASHAVDAIAHRIGSLAGKRALVIGSGTIGRLAAAGLAERQCRVAMTIRNPNASIDLPAGCRLVPFTNRYAEMEQCDIAVSATASPHFTFTRDDAEKLAAKPGVWVDLAIPRDFDPAIGDMPGIVLWNVDSFKNDGIVHADDHSATALVIVEEEAARFDLWRKNRIRRAPDPSGTPDFPLFISLHKAVVLVAGGGTVAARRIGKLLRFGAKIRLVSPTLSPETSAWAGHEQVEWLREEYASQHMDGVTLAIAATDDRAVNHRVGENAHERGILVSVADQRHECSFYFPAIAASDRLTAGIVSNNGDHALVRRAAAHIRQQMEWLDENDTGGE